MAQRPARRLSRVLALAELGRLGAEMVDPAEVPDDQSYVSTITIQVRDSSDQARPAPDGTLVEFSFLVNTAGAEFVGGVDSCTTTAGSSRC